MKLAIFGTGYVGLTTGACLADLGHTVTCVDVDRQRIDGLNKGQIPFYEPGLDKLLQQNHTRDKLFFVLDGATAARDNDVLFIAVGTPATAEGRVDLSQVMAVAETIGNNIDGYKLIVDKSTVPPGTGAEVRSAIGSLYGGDFDVVSNPEFLKEGSAIDDFMRSDRIVIGAESDQAVEIMRSLYIKLDCPLFATDLVTAEIIKYASNAYLATSISFINSVAEICEQTGGDVTKVAEGMRLDRRIGKYAFLNAGLGYGGSCFPKDVKGLIQVFDDIGVNAGLLKAVEEINRHQRERFIAKIKSVLPALKGKTIGIWGLAFKPESDDIREAPAIDIAKRLLKEGARLKAYDPVAAENTAKVLPDIEYCATAMVAAAGCDCLLIMTEWEEFKTADLALLKNHLTTPLVIDGRNIYKPDVMEALGFTYINMGRHN